MRHILAIYDQEEEYAYQLADFINEKKLPFEIRVFTTKEKVEEFIQIESIDIALIAEKSYTNDVNNWSIPYCILLNESGIKFNHDIESIYKYQTSENIVKEMLEHLVNNGMIHPSLGSKSTLQIIGLYSPIRRCLQTSFSFVLGQVLSKKYKVLYINFETYSGFTQLLQKEYHSNLSDLIYYLQNGKDKLNYRLGSMVEQVNGLDIVPPFLSYLDLMSVTVEEWIELLHEIQLCCDYDYLILDLSESVQGLFSILQNCNMIYTITREDGFATAKIEQYERLLKAAQCEDVLKKTKKKLFPTFRQLPKGIDQLPFSELAGYVRELVREDFYE
ncbi:MAG: hypothetical protein R3Y24_06205 [Eubacteriales bacterium]